MKNIWTKSLRMLIAMMFIIAFLGYLFQSNIRFQEILQSSKAQTSAPFIADVGGEFVDEETIMITGGGFGTKPQAGPVKWDTFDSGVAGAVVSNGWGIYNVVSGGEPRYSSERVRVGSTKSLRHDFVTPGNYNSSLNIHAIQNEYYFTWWMQYDQVGSDQAGPFPNTFNYKPHQMFGNTDGDDPLAQTGFGSPPLGDGGWRANIIDENGANDTHAGGSQSLWGDVGISALTDVWSRYECYYKQSSPGVSDGIIDCKIYRPGSALHSLTDTTVKTRSSQGAFWDQVLIGEYHRRSTADMSAYVYSDDVYFDSSRARVELCNASQWATRTSCEIQIPVSWTSGNVTMQFNQGAFASGQTAYLYVVDSNGAVNASGYLITVGGNETGTPDTTPPSAPTGLQVQ